MAKFTKVGIVRTSPKDTKKVFVALGNSQAKNKKYAFNTTVTVTDADGNVVAESKNGILAVMDPRKNPNSTDEQKAKLPEWLKQELFIVTND